MGYFECYCAAHAAGRDLKLVLAAATANRLQSLCICKHERVPVLISSDTHSAKHS